MACRFHLSLDYENCMDKIKVCLQTITNPEDAKSGELVDALKILDSILSENTMNLHPQLKHFLEKRSYQKALIWMDGEVPEKGTCGT